MNNSDNNPKTKSPVLALSLLLLISVIMSSSMMIYSHITIEETKVAGTKAIITLELELEKIQFKNNGGQFNDENAQIENDLWGNELKRYNSVEGGYTKVTLASRGADGKFGTKDDLSLMMKGRKIEGIYTILYFGKFPSSNQTP